jgi:hypothetical protein
MTLCEESQESNSEACKIVLMSQLQNDLTARNALIANLQQKLENTRKRNHRERSQAIICAADVAILIRSETREKNLLKQLGFLCLQHACLEAKHPAQVNRFEAKLHGTENNQSSMLPSTYHVEPLKHRMSSKTHNSKLRLQCFNAWLSYCDSCRFVLAWKLSIKNKSLDWKRQC